MGNKYLKWFHSYDTGISSKAIMLVLTAADLSLWRLSHPLDPSDLGRCIRMLAEFPELKARLSEMKAVSPVWSSLVENWDELETLYNEGLESGRKCYDRMQELIKESG